MNTTKLVLVLLFLSQSALSFHGRVKFIKGKAMRVRDQKTVVLKKGSDIREGDQVTLGGKRDLLLIGFGNDYRSTMKITDDSVIKFPKTKGKKTDIFMQVGNIVVDYLDGPKKPLEVNTPTASMGVRGTRFFVSEDRKGNFVLAVERGKVSVRSKRQNRKAVLIRKNGAATISAKGAVARAATKKITQRVNWNMDPDKQVIRQDSGIRNAIKKDIIKGRKQAGPGGASSIKPQGSNDSSGNKIKKNKKSWKRLKKKLPKKKLPPPPPPQN